MSYRVQGIINAFTKDAAVTTGAARTVGQLIHINNAGAATLTTDDLHFPLTEQFAVLLGDTVASAQVTGIAMVYVETATSIVAGSPVKAGTTGLGAALATAGQAFFGHALATPAGNGDLIPVLLCKGNVAAA